jgi:hypothetical protein
MRARTVAVTLAFLLLASFAGFAEEPPAATARTQGQIDAQWSERLAEAKETLAAARERAALAEARWGEARQRKRPRGEEREAIETELAEAREALAEAEAALPALVEEARRDGASAAVWTPYDE